MPDEIKNEQPLVSIITPAYNCDKYVSKTVESVISQTYINWEMIIVDDCSTDQTSKIIKEYSDFDSRIKYYKLDTNSGAAVARNQGIKMANGRYIAFLDSDDLWDDIFLNEQIDFIVSGKYEFVYSEYRLIDQEGKFITNYSPKKKQVKYSQIIKHNYIGCLTVIYDVEKIGKVFMPVNAFQREDLATWLKILKKIKYGYCNPKILASYRVGHSSVSSNKKHMIKYQWNVYRNVEKVNLIMSFYYIFIWAIKGLFKY